MRRRTTIEPSLPMAAASIFVPPRSIPIRNPPAARLDASRSKLLCLETGTLLDRVRHGHVDHDRLFAFGDGGSGRGEGALRGEGGHRAHGTAFLHRLQR